MSNGFEDAKLLAVIADAPLACLLVLAVLLLVGREDDAAEGVGAEDACRLRRSSSAIRFRLSSSASPSARRSMEPNMSSKIDMSIL
jgi:hypothetical protein